ncbi:MAG: rhamnan synthesis F family protein [Bacteroidia bacterium]
MIDFYNTNKKIVIIAHIFYENGWDLIAPQVKNLEHFQPALFVNICSNNLNKTKIINEINKTFQNAIVIISPNIGKDIGGKLAALDLSIRLNIKTDYYILLHDKNSPHTTLADMWREKLFKIVQKDNIPLILSLFLNNDKLGIVSAKEFISNEYDSKAKKFESTSNEIIKNLISKYQLNISNYDFVGGTMFWVKAEIYNNFFNKYNPLEIRATLEKGNVFDNIHGTTTHAWERILSYIAIDQDYYLNGI